MKKILAVTLSILSILALFTLAGCSNGESGEAERTVVDMRGESIVLPEKANKYCTVYSSSMPIISMLDKNKEHCVMYPKSGWFEYWEFEMFEGIEDHAVRVNKREVTAEQIVEIGIRRCFFGAAHHIRNWLILYLKWEYPALMFKYQTKLIL